MKKQIIKTLTDREHILARPSLYMGGIDYTTQEEFILDNGIFKYKEVTFIPGFLKIVNEILDNSIDEGIKTNFKFANEIKVFIKNGVIEIIDNGRGIPTDKNEEDIPLPRLCWGYAKAGGNFDDDEERVSIGLNGVGSYLTNCYSISFKGKTDDGDNCYSVSYKNNAETFTEVYQPSKGNTGTRVKFTPDLQRFGLEVLDETHIELIRQRLLHLAVSYPQIRFKFNGKLIKGRNEKDYLQTYGEVFEMIKTKDYIIGVFPNNSEDFIYNSFVNGLHLKKGGNHINLITNSIVNGIREKLVKKYKTIKPGDIKNKLQLIVIFRNFKNPMFESQTKEALTSANRDIVNYLGDINYQKIINKLLKTPEIIDPIIEIFKIKEEFKHRQALKNIDKSRKKIRGKHILLTTGKKEGLFLCEGLSAMGGISPVFGRERFTYYAGRGIPLNVIDCKIQKIIKNKEISEISNLLNLSLSGQDTVIEYDYIVLGADEDADGSHIKGLYLGFFKQFGLKLLEDGRVKKLRTPLITLSKKGQIKHFFFTLDEYQNYINTHDVKGYDQKYYKGLGSWKEGVLEKLVKKHGEDMFIEPFVLDKKGLDIIDDWLKNDRADIRKNMISTSKFDINSV